MKLFRNRLGYTEFGGWGERIGNALTQKGQTPIIHSTSMPFYRIISRKEVEALVQSGFVPRNFEPWGEHQRGTIICFFEEQDFIAALNRFAATIGEQRSLAPDDKLYVIQLFNLVPDQIRPDTTALGWRSSRIYLAPVNIENVKVVASMVLKGTSSDCLQAGQIDSLTPPKSPAEVLR